MSTWIVSLNGGRSCEVAADRPDVADGVLSFEVDGSVVALFAARTWTAAEPKDRPVVWTPPPPPDAPPRASIPFA